jgi:nitric oxide reductase NorE protein
VIIETAERARPSGLQPSPIPLNREDAIRHRKWVPGEPGLWALIFTDLGVFTTYFVIFMVEWQNHPAQWAEGHAAISLTAGILNTFFLLTASFFVALGIQTMRLGRIRLTQQLFLGAAISGALFVGNKYLEWSDKINAGHDPNDSAFLQMYFVITGIHLAHVLIAMVLLSFMSRRVRHVRGEPTPHQARFIENCATYWHMVDLLWLGILALFYLMGGTA